MAKDSDWNGNQKGMGNTPLKPFRDPITKQVVPQNPQGDAYPVGSRRGGNLEGNS
ncbi:hypothetical protein WHZ78_17615 [Bradyrhizobium symbiodeficiens]|uniref:hypothetical protein n=1 Tax=Bradyrhizobium symbiodeficiens TaxID=1404367 RepID=UPI0030CEBB77